MLSLVIDSLLHVSLQKSSQAFNIVSANLENEGVMNLGDEIRRETMEAAVLIEREESLVNDVSSRRLYGEIESFLLDFIWIS